MLIAYKMKKLSEQLKQARMALNLTQAELAQRIGAYQTKYQGWEKGRVEPDIDTIKKLADALGVSTDWLLGRDETAKPYPTEFDKEIFLLREAAKQYGPESVKKIRKMLPLIFDKKKGK